MHREELVGIQTIWWVDYQLAVGFLTGSWKSNMDVWISNQLFGNPTACLSWPRCNGATRPKARKIFSRGFFSQKSVESDAFKYVVVHDSFLLGTKANKDFSKT